jgi:RluA family pseudouridine synthase
MDFQSEQIEQWIIWKDDNLVVVNKPAGILSLPDGYDHSQPYLQSILQPIFGRLWIVHRLDRETSGVLVMARSAQAHHLLNDQFAERQVEKSYHALIGGNPAWAEIEVNLPLRKNGDRHHRTVIDQQYGKPATTIISAIERYPGFTLVKCSPKTGYTHQIRAHLSAIGFPLAGDLLYGGINQVVIREKATLVRVGLHAYEISFSHPKSGEQLRFMAPYPHDFTETLTGLRALER